MAEWRRFPIWACLSAIWQVLTHDAYVPSSKILTLVHFHKIDLNMRQRV